MKKRKPTNNEMRHMWRVKCLPCACCGAAGPSHAHHVRHQGNRIGHYATIPLCDDCHVPPCGVHGDKTLMRAHKKTELGMLNDTIGRICDATNH